MSIWHWNPIQRPAHWLLALAATFWLAWLSYLTLHLLWRQHRRTADDVLKAEVPFVPLEDGALPSISVAVTVKERSVRPGSAHHLSPLRALHRHEMWWLAAILLVVGIAHAFNMFNFPYYENDEGTYMSRAWAVINLGQLAPYTYWYDHAPLGWMLIAAWVALTGGFFTFGTAVETGRVLMLVLQMFSALMVYQIARQVTRNVLAATIATLTFGLSAYGIYFHRRVLLDNLATFWMLLSIALLLSGRLSLTRVWISAAAFAASVLSKEITIALVPVIGYLAYYRSHRSHRSLAAVGWLAIAFSLISLYVVFSVIKGELFPAGTALGGEQPHVSLIEALLFQASRSRDGGLLNMQSGFWQYLHEWVRDDPLLVIGGTIAAVASAALWWRNRPIAILGIASLSLWAFLARGGVTIIFYLVPLIPLLAINIGSTVGLAIRAVDNRLVGRRALTLVWHAATPAIAASVIAGTAGGYVILGTFGGYWDVTLRGFHGNPFVLWNGTEAKAGREVIDWVKIHLDPSDRILIDMYMWADLHDPWGGSTNTPRTSFPDAHWYWKAAEDPAIAEGRFGNDWRSVDYVITTHQMILDMKREHMRLVEDAVANSTLVRRFDTDGWPLEIRKVDVEAIVQSPS